MYIHQVFNERLLCARHHAQGWAVVLHTVHMILLAPLELVL